MEEEMEELVKPKVTKEEESLLIYANEYEPPSICEYFCRYLA
jgi:hypothetical protein